MKSDGLVSVGLTAKLCGTAMADVQFPALLIPAVVRRASLAGYLAQTLEVVPEAGADKNQTSVL